MSNLEAQDRYVDAFWGKVPKSVLAICYIDYSSKRLREIYEKADLRTLKN